jgi:Tetratricopeptide repeat
VTDSRATVARRVMWPYGALGLFLLVVRIAPSYTRPASPADDCERVSQADSGVIERCLAVRPEDIELMIDLADRYQRSGDRDRAEALYRRALTVDPEDGEVRRRLDALPPPHAGGA